MVAHMRGNSVISSRCRALVFLTIIAAASPVLPGRDPVVVPDPQNPGYYKPFTCVAFAPGKGPFGEEGRITNNCGHVVEVNFHDGKSNSMITLGAGNFTTAFVPVKRGPVGCLKNDGFDWSLQRCRGPAGSATNARQQPPAPGRGSAAADQLAKELGITRPSSPSSTDQSTDADRLAAELGVGSSAKPSAGALSADDLEKSLVAWNLQQKAAEEEQRQREAAESARLAKERQLAYERQQRAAILEEQQRSIPPPEEKSSLWGSVLAAGAVFAGAKAGGMDTASAAIFAADAVSDDPDTGVYGGASIASGAAACPASKKSQIERALRDELARDNQGSICRTGRNLVSLADRLDAITGGQCAEYQAQIDHLRAQGRADMRACGL